MRLKLAKILVDIDETVLLASDALEDFCNERLKSSPVSSVINIQTAYNISDETSHNLIHDFWHSDIMRNLKPLPCALDVLPRLYRQGWDFVGITAVSDDPEVVKAREENLADVFGFKFEKVHCTGYHYMTSNGDNVKAKYLAQYEPTIWVEDSFHNAVAGALLGHTAFLINRIHNDNDDKHGLVRRVADWYEIEKYIDLHM